MFFLHNALVPKIYYDYTCGMKSSIEVLVIAGTIIFGMSIVKWMNNFTPSFIREEEIEMVIEE